MTARGNRRLAAVGGGLVLMLAPLAVVPAALASPSYGDVGQAVRASPTPHKTTASPKPTTHRPSATPTHTKVPTTTVQPVSAPVCRPNYTAPPLSAALISSITPWAQYRLNPGSAWGLSKGAGVKVAVVDSGVDGSHPQLAGQVVKEVDLTHTKSGDCYGHGTAVAAIIAGKQLPNVPFAGVAPEAKIISIKFVEQDGSQGASVPMWQAIRAAVDANASVINVSAVANAPSPELESAVKYAQQHDVLIVAAAGNVNNNQQAVTEYPASYDGVLSVAALNQDGSVTGFSNDQSRVDVASPGQGILSAAAGGGYINGLEGTSFATPYAAGLAALVRSRFPNLSYRDVITRIKNTADGNLGKGTGSGMINPYQALTRPDVNTPAHPQGAARAVSIEGPPPVDHRTRQTGLLIAVGAIGIAAVAGAAGIVVPAGRRRGWRPTRAVVPTRTADKDD